MKNKLLIILGTIFISMSIFADNVASLDITGTLVIKPAITKNSIQTNDIKINEKFNDEEIQKISKTFTTILEDAQGNTIPTSAIEYSMAGNNTSNIYDLNNNSVISSLKNDITVEDKKLTINLNGELPNGKYLLQDNLFIKFKDEI